MRKDQSSFYYHPFIKSLDWALGVYKLSVVIQQFSSQKYMVNSMRRGPTPFDTLGSQRYHDGGNDLL